MMTCTRVKRLLSSHQDGELPPALNGEIDAHLKRCRDCRTESETLKRIGLELDRLTEIEPADDFPVRIMERLQPKREKITRFVPSFVYSVAFLVAFLLGFLLSIPAKQQPAPEKKIMNLSATLTGSRQMGLLSVQDQTIRLIQGGLYEKK